MKKRSRYVALLLLVSLLAFSVPTQAAAATVTVSQSTGAKCIITFDDGYESVYTNAFSYMRPLGLKGTLYALRSGIEYNDPGFIKKAQLNEMYAYGWAIGNHTSNHQKMNTLTPAEIRTILEKCKNWLIDNGWTKAADHVAYPYGAYNSNVLDVMAEMGAKTGRTMQSGLLTNGDNIYELKTKEMYSTRTLANAKAIIDDAIAKQTTVTLTFHKIVDSPSSSSEWSTANFQGLCDYLVQRNQDIEVVTIDEWYRNIAPPSIEITGFDAISDVNAGMAGATLFSKSTEVQSVLPTSITANGGSVTVPVTAWIDTDGYDPNRAGSYTFTAVLGAIPSGYANSANYTATVEVFLAPSPIKRAKCIITFDDGYDSVYTNAFSYMQPLGLKGTIYALRSGIEYKNPGFISKAQLNEMYADGWAIGNHTSNHQKMNTLTPEEIRTILEKCKNWLIDNGWTKAADHVAYPYGAYNSNVLNVMAEMGAKTGRTMQSGLLTNGDNPYELKTKEMYSTRTLENAKLIIDDAIAKQTTVTLTFHKIVDSPSSSSEWSTANFQGLCDYLVQRNQDIEVVTIDEWYNGN